MVVQKDTPLADFHGQFSLISAVHVVVSGNSGVPEADIRLRDQDIVFERASPFAVEIILTSEIVSLPPRSERPNSVVYLKHQLFPMIMVEVFDCPKGVMPVSRFPRTTPLQTTFFDEGIGLPVTDLQDGP